MDPELATIIALFKWQGVKYNIETIPKDFNKGNFSVTIEGSYPLYSFDEIYTYMKKNLMLRRKR
jgi:hypothetical protein